MNYQNMMNRNNNAGLMQPNPIADQYVRIKALGKGSFGCAWLVERKKDRAQLVAKEVKLMGMKPHERDAARHEISMLRQLNHPNITRYVDHYEHNGSLFIVMEFANGGDLLTKIQSRRGIRFSEKEVMHFFCQLALAIMYLHEKRILHRDLKTQNVFLTRDGVVKLGDFGISTVLRNTVELKKTVCGTPYYFSPELCQSKPYNNKSDVWALGCILYEMTTLQHAFEGNNMKALVQKILKGVYPPIHSSYTSNLSSVISTMLRLDPAKRPSAHEIVQLPYVREGLAALQQTAAVANRDHRSLVDPADKIKEQKEAQKRVEDERAAKARRDAEAKTRQEAKEKEHQQRVEQIRAQMQQEVQQHEEKLKKARDSAAAQEKERAGAEEKRRLDLLERLKKQEEDLKRQEAERKQKEIERQRRAAEERKRLEEDRKKWEEEKKKQDEERRTRALKEVAIHRKREQEWEKGMKQAIPEKEKEKQAAAAAAAAQVQAQGGGGGGGQQQQQPGSAQVSLDENARAQAYREMRAQADANRRRTAELEYGKAVQQNNNNNNFNIGGGGGGGQNNKQDQQQQQPVSRNNNNNNKDSETLSLDPEARRQALLAMRREAEENRKRVEKRESPVTTPPVTPIVPATSSSAAAAAAGKEQQQQQQQKEPSAHSSPCNSNIDEAARREAFFQMRREAEANRRKLLGQDEPSSAAAAAAARKVSPPPPPAPAPVSTKSTPASATGVVVDQKPQQQSQRVSPPSQKQQPSSTSAASGVAAAEDIVVSATDEDDDDEENGVDGSVGLHRFLNNDAMAAIDDDNNNEEEEEENNEGGGDNNKQSPEEKKKEQQQQQQQQQKKEEEAITPSSKKKKDKQRENEYADVTNCITEALEKSLAPPPDFEDDASSVVDPFTFILDGKALNLPDVRESDPLGHRIESLRYFLEKCFGDDMAFVKIYRRLCKLEEVEDNVESEKMLQTLRKELTEEHRRYLPLVTQLIVCEDVFNTQHNHQ